MGRRHSCWAQCKFNAVRSAGCKRWGMQSNGAVHFRRWLHLGGPVPSVLLKVAAHGVDRVFFMDTGRAGRQNGVPMRVEPPVLVQDYLVAAKTGEQVPFQANSLVDADGLSWHSSDSLLRPDASDIFDRIAW